MVKLLDHDLQTREILQWTGVHLFHFAGSSCSQKTRIFLNLKEIDWESHPIDLMANANFDPWYLGINPRGLVPTLVIDGEVHIESNDILTELERRFPRPRLIPAGREREVASLLRHEDDLHLDLRTLTFRFIRPYEGPFRSAEALGRYRSGGSGTVVGLSDAHKQREIDFWERNNAGIPDSAVRTSAAAFKASLDELDANLATAAYLLGDQLTVLDIAWYVYAVRLTTVGYPLQRLHPRVHAWFEALHAREAFAREVARPARQAAAIARFQDELREKGHALSDIAML